MRQKNGFDPKRIMNAFCELQEPFGRRHPIWCEASVIALQLGVAARMCDIVGVERALRVLKREKLVQRKTFRSVAYYSLTKLARDKYLEE